jgi:hypothetical protein
MTPDNEAFLRKEILDSSRVPVQPVSNGGLDPRSVR